MPNENLQRRAEGLTLQTYFVNDTYPYAVLDKNGAVLYWVPGTGHFVSTSTPSSPIQMRKQRISATTPGFNSKNRPKPLPPQNFTFIYDEFALRSGYNRTWVTPLSVHSGPGTAGYQDSNTTWFNLGGSVGNALADPTAEWVSQLQAKALQKLSDALKDSSINAAQAVAERKQVTDMFAKTATRVAKALGSLRKGDIVSAARDLEIVPPKRARRRFNKSYAKGQADAVGNAWLELTYGWKPLLSDVYGAAEHLAKSQNNRLLGTATGKAQRKEAKTQVKNGVLGSGYTGIDTYFSQMSASVEVRYKVLYEKSSPTVQNLSQLGITNPALLAWELLPYSFVIDWFLPIGNWLGSLDATLGLTFLSGYGTTFRRFEGSASHVISKSNDYTHNSVYDRSTEKLVMCTRTKLLNFPSVPFPSFKNPISTSHVASAMALLLQLKR